MKNMYPKLCNKVTLSLWASALLDRMLLFRVITSKTENSSELH